MLSQRLFRYLQDGDVPDRKFHVPIFLRIGTKQGTVNQTVLLTDQELHIQLPEDLDWVVANAGGHGFYRVRYNSELMAAVKRELQSNLLPVGALNLVNDTWATTLAGLASLTDYLDLIDLLRDETDLNVWTTVIISSHHLHRILDDVRAAISGADPRCFQYGASALNVVPEGRGDRARATAAG